MSRRLAPRIGPVTVEMLKKKLTKQLGPVFEKAAQIAAELGAEILRDEEHLGVDYPRASLVRDYPRKRTGSLRASVGSTKAVIHKNTYQAAFGVIKDVLIGADGKFQPHHRESGEKRTLPTMYAKYLEAPRTATNRAGGRKMAMSAWREIRRNGKLQAALAAGLKGFRTERKAEVSKLLKKLGGNKSISTIQVRGVQKERRTGL